MTEPRAQQAADATRQLNGGMVGSGGYGRAGASEPSTQAAPPVWDFGSAAASARPVTPSVDSAHGSPWRHAPAPAPQAMARQQQQQRPSTPSSSHATPPSGRTGSGLLRAVRASSGSLTGLLRRPNTAAPTAGASPGGSPLFEVRGAAMLPPEPPRPATAGSAGGHAAAHTQRPATAAPNSQLQQHKYTGASPSSYNIQARAGQRAAAAATSPSSSSPAATPQQRQPTAVAAHGLELGYSPRGSPAAMSLAQQMELAAAAAAAAAARQHRMAQGQGQAQGQPAHGPAGNAPAAHGSSSSSSRFSMSTSDRSSSGDGGGSSGSARGATAAPPGAASAATSATTTTVHSNPLFSSGSEAYGKPLRRQHQQPQPAGPVRAPPPVRTAAGAGAAAAASTPHTPVAGPSQPSAGTTPGASPLGGTLQAASNLTVVNDSRPISPGPFMSNLASGALPDSTSARSHPSRPVSPQCVDSAPPTPGSFAPLGTAAAAAARGGSNLSPIKTGAAATQSRSLPASPAVPAAVAASAAAAGPAANVFRLPIFNQDGRLVGYKQNSNLIPRPGACISSAPSSPNRSAPSTSDAFPQASADGASPPGAVKAAAAATVQQAPAPVAPPPSPVVGAVGEFAEYLADPCRGFPDADNMVSGYVLGPMLGKGGFCSVRKALHELTGQAVACKIIEKGKLKDPKDRDRVDRECRVMRNLSNHVAVVKLFEYVETRDYVYIMMEAAKRGSLLDYVRDRKKLPEEEAVTIFQQLLHALQFCHRKDVVHRDIKLENILIDSAGHMKLIDFGLCGYYVAGKRLRCHCGSPSYAAPEIVARKDYLGPPVDVWSLGIVLFAMLAGYLPFHAKEKKQLSEKILAGVYKPAAWMSSAAQDLISRMLTLDPDQRITLEGVWAHPWVAHAPRWEPPGVGAGQLYRALTDPTTGAILPEDAVLAQLEMLGADTTAIRRALRSRECNSLTATYHLMFEARTEAQRALAAREHAAAGERAAAAAAKKAAPAASSAGDWQWDFASISAAANMAVPAGAAPAGSGSGSSAVSSHASAGSSSLRGSSSPVRPCTANISQPGGSPTRFGQEAAAAGYLGTSQRHGMPPTGAVAAAALAWEHRSGSGGSSHGSSALQQAAAAARAAAHAHAPSPAAPAGAEWDIKAVRAGGAQEQGPAAPAAAEVAQPGGPAAAIVVTTATVADCAASPNATSKSPLPAVLSPKQLQLVPGGTGPAGGASGEHSPPIAQAV